MLGFETPREPIRGEFARQIQAKMKRIYTNNLNAEDMVAIKTHRDRMRHRRYDIKWDWQKQIAINGNTSD